MQDNSAGERQRSRILQPLNVTQATKPFQV
jgi:hypothetical protein